MNCDFYLGDRTATPLQLMDYRLLKHFKGIIKFIPLFSSLYWQKGAVKLVFHSHYKDFIIDGQPIGLAQWMILLFGKALGKRVYLWSHGWYGKESTIKKVLKKLFCKLAYGIFVYGNNAKRMMIENGLNENKIHIIYNSLAYDEQNKIRNRLVQTNIYTNHFNNDCYNLIFVGRLTKEKQLTMLLQALSELNKQSEKYNLTLIGNGIMRHELTTLASKLNIEGNVWFYGATYDEKELSELIFNADLCVSPGNVGLTAIHALTYGCPVITHDNFPYQMPEFEAIKQGETGDFFKYNDIHSLVRTIQKWTVLGIDREEIRKKCYEIIDTKYNPHYQINVLKNQIK